MRVGVLGAAEVFRDETPVDLGTRKQRALLAALALHRGRPVAVDSIIDLLWSDRPPAGVQGTLQGYVAGLRRALEPDRRARSAASVLVTVAPGYALHLPAADLDAARFDEAVARAHHRLAPMAQLDPRDALSAAELEEVHATLDSALALWRGVPYQELEDAPTAAAERVRLEELRLLALEDRAVAGLGLGRHATVAAELEALTAAHPLRERLWALRAMALTRSGRQADALDVLQQVRRLLADELGIEPGAELRALQTAVLRQDPVLEWHPEEDPHPVHVRARVPDQQDGAKAAPWPMVGRDAQLDALTDLLGIADSGTPTFASLVGDPGIGKSRLAAELAERARARGVAVLVGRCSQDEGAPPLWPWVSVLEGLGHALPGEVAHEDEGSRFRSWDQIVRILLDEAAKRTLLVVLDDLHWADVSSLRVLRLLAESATRGRLMLLGTWRNHPEPTGALGSVAESLARRHALRLELAGLSQDEVARVVEAVGRTAPSSAEAHTLLSRTDGNPFFLVEYARLADERGSLSALLDEAHPPAAVNDVLGRRLERLPEDTVRVLRAAAVAGRDFDLRTVADATGLNDDHVLDHLDPAIEAGLLRDKDVERFRFAHALVRDSVYTAMSTTRRARLHARIAEALQDRPGREAELARHWLSAGPRHAARGWRAARSAAASARRVYAYEEAVDLLRAALAAVDHDPEARARDRYDLLLELAAALQWAGDWTGLGAVTHDAIRVADDIGDVELLARAAVTTTTGALWQAAAHGFVDEVIASALRRALDRLPPGDSPLRCRVMLSLAGEIYYGSSPAERESLVDEGLAMARRIGDPALLLTGCQLAFNALWRSATAERRLALSEEAVALARVHGEPAAMTAPLVMLATVTGELGRVDEMWEAVTEARELAQAHRHVYALLVLVSLEIPWLTMAGDFEAAEQRLNQMRELGEKMSLAQYDDAVAGAAMVLRLLQGRAAEVVPLAMAMDQATALPTTATVLLFLLRAGMADEARAFYAGREIDLEADTWFSMLVWGASAEDSLHLGDRALAAAAYGRLAPFAGRACTAGSGVALGPVDAFLAMAAATTGDRGRAARHADEALALCEKWAIPLAAAWLRDQREAYSF
ncbi:MAG TPA: BTAD domain-containing putative transcriptional regulator [Nocardioidaceae bacterium]|nr:BTAD domain-containing putative transcriptional regulator [Nocardioidaceae bacterium]